MFSADVANVPVLSAPARRGQPRKHRQEWSNCRGFEPTGGTTGRRTTRGDTRGRHLGGHLWRRRSSAGPRTADTEDGSVVSLFGNGRREGLLALLLLVVLAAAHHAGGLLFGRPRNPASQDVVELH